MKTTSTGVQIIKEFTNNTCEWTRLMQADLKLSSEIPKSALDFIVKAQMGYANKAQEKFRRNGREVDRERVNRLAGIMIARRGKPLMDDQVRLEVACTHIVASLAFHRNAQF